MKFFSNKREKMCVFFKSRGGNMTYTDIDRHIYG